MTFTRYDGTAIVFASRLRCHGSGRDLRATQAGRREVQRPTPLRRLRDDAVLATFGVRAGRASVPFA